RHTRFSRDWSSDVCSSDLGLTLCLTFAMQMGASLVLLPHFDVDQVLAAVKRRPPTFVPGVPTMFDRLAQAAKERGVDLTSIRFRSEERRVGNDRRSRGSRA